MTHSLWRAGQVAMVSWLALVGWGETLASEVSLIREYDCGIQSIYFLVILEGIRCDLSKVADSAGDAVEGRTMAELQDLARRCGLTLDGVRLQSDLGSLDRPALVFLESDGVGHYVIVRSVGHSGRLIQVLDPNRAPDVLDAVDLPNASGWTGLALIPRRPNWPLRIVGSLLFLAGMAGLLGVARRLGKSRNSPPPNSFRSASVSP